MLEYDLTYMVTAQGIILFYLFTYSFINFMSDLFQASTVGIIKSLACDRCLFNTGTF